MSFEERQSIHIIGNCSELFIKITFQFNYLIATLALTFSLAMVLQLSHSYLAQFNKVLKQVAEVPHQASRSKSASRRWAHERASS